MSYYELNRICELNFFLYYNYNKKYKTKCN